MTNTSQVSLRPSKRLKNPSVSFSPVEISDSSMDDLPASSASNKNSSPSGHASKKHKADSVDFKPEDLQLFWSSVEKAKFIAFKDRTSAPGRVICLNQLEGSHCPVKMFYANLRVSKDNGELETLVLGYRIVLSQDLLEKVFGTKFSGRIPFFSGNWPDDFEKGSNLSDFGPSTICFEHRILAHIVATTLLPRKSSLSSLTIRDVFVVYCLIRKIKIYWAEWFLGYMEESSQDSSGSASLPYGMVISRILKVVGVDLSEYTANKISATYDLTTFASMGYTFENGRWTKKALSKPKVGFSDKEKATATSEIDILKIKHMLAAVVDGLQKVQDSLSSISTLSEGTSSGMGNLKLQLNHLRSEVVKSFNKVLNQVDSKAARVEVSQNELATAVQRGNVFVLVVIEEGDGDIVLGDLAYSERLRDFGYCRCFRIEEVLRAISRMSRGRATGPDEILVEFWKSTNKAGIEWLTRLFNVIFRTAKMPDEWRWSTMVPLYKNKGDIQNYNNYRGVKLLSHTLKIWERVVEIRVRRGVPIF
ncbi:hypothetical protein H5410_062153 [Solanum commersonii]|uniref:Uncharacterized protein n=1 Tax=Solanum commersonii TaxID=4109 RepID=A0A9J5W9M6_SOLCO|nr:hypothetical protein H5410_062153 [Solanum commersonii]